MDRRLGRGRRPAPIATAPDPDPAVPPEPTPGPSVPGFTYNGPSDPAAYTASGDALQALADARGVPALEEIGGALRALDGAIRDAAAVPDPARLRDAQERRRIYLARATALGELLRADPGIPDPPDVPTPDELEERAKSQAECRDAVEAARRGLDLADDGMRTATSALADDGRYGRANEGPSLQWAGDREIRELGRTVRRRLAEVDGRPDHADRPVLPHEIPVDVQMLVHALGRQPNARVPRGWHMDAALRAWDAAAEARRVALAGLELAEAKAARHRERVSERLRKAIGKGGASRIVDAVIAAQLFGRMPEELSGLVADVQAATSEHATIGQQIDRLAGAGIDRGEAWDQLRAAQQSEMTRLRGLRDELARRHRGIASDLVDRAIAGDDAAARRLGELARANRGVFPRGFAEALGD